MAIPAVLDAGVSCWFRELETLAGETVNVCARTLDLGERARFGRASHQLREGP